MNFSDFITHHGKRVKRNAFVHLVQISRIDGQINDEELELLHKEGKKFGLTDPEIDKLIGSEKDHHYHPPYFLEDKFEHLYNIAEMILADEIVKDIEKKMIKRFAIEAGFEYSKIDDIVNLLLDGIKANSPEEELFRKFKTTILG